MKVLISGTYNQITYNTLIMTRTLHKICRIKLQCSSTQKKESKVMYTKKEK